MRDSFARVEDSEIFLYSMHVTPYEQGSRYNPDPTRIRQLLLNRAQINHQQSPGDLTLVPVNIQGGKVRSQRCEKERQG